MNKKLFSRSSLRGINIITLWILVVGLILIIFGGALPKELGNLHFANIAAEVGSFLCASVAVHWLFDIYSKKELMEDIVSSVLSSSSLALSGIVGYVNSIYSIDYETAIVEAKELIIGFNYSNQFLSEYQEHLRVRINKNQETTVVLLDPGSDAAGFLKSSRKDIGRLNINQKSNLEMLEYINNDASNKINVLKHACILKYSFFITENMVWIRFYKNADQSGPVPAIKIKSSSELYKIFRGDIEALLKCCEKYN